MNSISDEIKELLTRQKSEWELAGKNFAGLASVKIREFVFDRVTIKVQFNPGRIVSSAANIDKKSIDARPCFLCTENRPKEQRSVKFGHYGVLVNPFPIFPEHFTVAAFAHIPQRIKGNFESMLALAQAMEGFTLFYNGPKCGASAPDHFHFQAGNNGFMPVENELETLKGQYGDTFSNGDVEVSAIKDGLRNFLFLTASNKTALSTCFEGIYQAMNKPAVVKEEPMMNMLAWFAEKQWRILIFPRALHRPWQYSAGGEANILLSPASVDMGGVLVTPLEKDFNKIGKNDIEDILRQVLWSDEKFDDLVSRIK
ncbi:DUF4922 domain-containing protein [Mariniphaga sediminis]|uniref:DUF4922 domain-containing protein n=1 Tax=Mariniphaga sediminis TaxID=1628158 RepID=A0A399D164_9BACT|nr:DUF4922 domain-containing protein [Mariniphaga sediminis]RIH64928.1 DUF4922 domain-containing protein [Mariniphaga sediminis]